MTEQKRRKEIELKMTIICREFVLQKLAFTGLIESFFHIKNEGKTSQRQGKLNKRMGVTAGVSDIFLSRSNDQYKGLWIELKTPGNKPTKEQLKFISDRIAEGYWAFWTDDLKFAIREIIRFYNVTVEYDESLLELNGIFS